MKENGEMLAQQAESAGVQSDVEPTIELVTSGGAEARVCDPLKVPCNPQCQPACMPSSLPDKCFPDLARECNPDLRRPPPGPPRPPRPPQ